MINAVFVGLDNAGKTSIKLFLQHLHKERALKTKASTNIEKFSRAGLSISVIPGQKFYRENERFYRVLFPSADYIVFVVDAADKDRIEEAKEYFQFIKKMRKKFGIKKPKLIILAHKQDVEGALSADEVKELIAGKRSTVNVLETSIHDMVSMLILLRSLFGTLRGNYIDYITQALQDRLLAEGVALYDPDGLPLSVVGNKELIEKIYNRYFDTIFREREFHYGVISINGSRFAAAMENAGKYKVTILVANFDTGLEDVLTIIREAAKYYAKEFERRWKETPDNPWNI